MELQIDSGAAKWYIRELELSEGNGLRFFPRYSSGGGLHPGFSLGIAVEAPVDPVLQEQREGITFYMEQHDGWYLKGYRLHVQYVEAEDDIIYHYEELN